MTEYQTYSIVFLEFDGHWDCTDGFCRYFEDTNFQITILCDFYIYSNLKGNKYGDNISFIIKEQEQSRNDFILSQKNKFNSADIVFLDTVNTNLKDFISIDTNGIMILRVHNSFKQFKPLEYIHVPLGFFYWKKAFSYFLREIIFSRYLYYHKKINSKTDYFTFLSESITQYAISENLVNKNKVMFSIPISPYYKTSFEKPVDKIIISIVGVLDKRKKDYKTVTIAIRNLFNNLQIRNKKIALYFLGNASGMYGRNIVKKINEIKDDRLEFHYYLDSVPVSQFEAVLSRSHIILSPIRIKNYVDIFQEIYGLTKFSGSIGTIIKFPAIGIFPAEFQFDHEFSNHFLSYKNADDLCNILLNLISNSEEIEKHLENLRTFLNGKFNKNIILEKFNQFLINHFENK